MLLTTAFYIKVKINTLLLNKQPCFNNYGSYKVKGMGGDMGGVIMRWEGWEWGGRGEDGIRVGWELGGMRVGMGKWAAVAFLTYLRGKT